jgi:GPI-anchor transamidase subunit K
MLPDSYACNPRNTLKGAIIYNPLNEGFHDINADDIEVDYRDTDITSTTLLNLFRGRSDANLSQSKKLLSDSDSIVTVYISSHGGEGFVKIQDTDIIQGEDMNDALNEMHNKKRYSRNARYKEMLFVLDTCKSFSFTLLFDAPNIHVVSSTDIHENAVSLQYDPVLHEHLNDVFSYHFVKYLKERMAPSTTFKQLFNGLTESTLRANIKYRSTGVTQFENKVR